MKLNINPFSEGNPMTLRDAAVVSTIVAFVTWILTFLANASVGQLRADPTEFVFDALKEYAIAWAGSFISLAGLEQVVKRTRPGGESRA